MSVSSLNNSLVDQIHAFNNREKEDKTDTFENEKSIEHGPLPAKAPVLQRHVLTPLLSKKIPPVPDDSERTLYPQSVKNFPSYVFYWWLLPIMKVGYKRTLENEDLWKLNDGMKVDALYETFQKHLSAGMAKNRAKAKNKNPNVTEEELEDAAIGKYTIPLAFFKTIKRSYLIGLCLTIMYNALICFLPLVTKELINFVAEKSVDPSLPVNRGIGYTFGAAAMLLVAGLATNIGDNLFAYAGIQNTAILTKALLEKAFKIDSKAKQAYNTGKITSMMGADLSRINFALSIMPFLIAFPVPFVIIVVLLIVNIGVSALVGIGVFLLIGSVAGYLSKFQVGFREEATKHTDHRISLVTEVVNSLRMIKFYSWEIPYLKRISEHRKNEMKHVLNLHLLRVVFVALVVYLPTLSSIVSFLVMHAIDPNRSIGAIFASVSLFGLFSQYTILVPIALGSAFDTHVAFGRITSFLKTSEEKPVAEHEEDAEKASLGFVEDPSKAIQIVKGEFKWDTIDIKADDKDDVNYNSDASEKQRLDDKNQDAELKPLNIGSSTVVDSSTFTGLHDINVDINKGEFVIITGSVGCGKTSLLNAIAGFMPKKSGVLQVNGSLLLGGYPWVLNATVKENVLFGEKYDEVKYKKVLESCSLDTDLASFPAGDRTEVGERGITLSGGQKARISLARAVYNDSEIILLDDVLSAVDAKVGKHIMQSCIMDFLEGKTRVLATHQLSLASYATKVIFVDMEGYAHVGSAAALQAQSREFLRLMEFSNQKLKEEDEDKAEKLKVNAASSDTDLQKQLTKVDKGEQREVTFFADDGKLIEDEEKAVNKIKWTIYKTYFTTSFPKAPLLLFLIFVLFLSVSTFLQMFTNVWLSFWTDNRFSDKSSSFYMGIYGMLGVTTLFFTIFQFGIVTYVSNKSSRILNNKAIEKVLFTPMSFLDTTPTGRILNRFTKDTDILDNELGDLLRLVVYGIFNVVGTLIICIIYLPWAAIAFPFLIAIVIAMTSYYQASAREVKRLEAINRSFVFNNFNECLNGMSTIKAYRKEARFLLKNDNYIDTHNEAAYVSAAIQHIFASHSEILGFAFVLLIGLLCVTRQFNISASSTGLVLSFIFQIVGMLMLLVKNMTLIENDMNSVERLIYYAHDIPQEAAYEVPETKPEASWPEHGSIEFQDVCLRYREKLPLILKRLSFKVNAAEKIGICGRTGAGKSSLMAALYRLTELETGRIIIDCVDISTIGLHDLRSKLCIIPQDPVLFKGTVRRNLDPFSNNSDDELWNALRRSGLIEASQLSAVKKQVIQDDKLNTIHKFHLDQQVQEEGSNFSLGERQLIALARALVRKVKILVMDEAASSVDYETDAKINHTIKTEFRDCTILCIAHRLNTILNYDRILVMDNGSVKEFDTPRKLFGISHGIFREMCKRSQINETSFEK